MPGGRFTKHCMSANVGTFDPSIIVCGRLENLQNPSRSRKRHIMPLECKVLETSSSRPVTKGERLETEQRSHCWFLTSTELASGSTMKVFMGCHFRYSSFRAWHGVGAASLRQLELSPNLRHHRPFRLPVLFHPSKPLSQTLHHVPCAVICKNPLDDKQSPRVLTKNLHQGLRGGLLWVAERDFCTPARACTLSG